MEIHSQWQPRTRIVVKLRTVDGETLEGFIFAPSDMRVSDVVNSSRPFLPFVGNDGKFSLIAKACLVRVMPDCIAPGSLDTSLSHAAGLSDIAVCHA